MKPATTFTECIEVYAGGGVRDGTLIGYAVRFAGSWDGWRVNPINRSIMERVAMDEPTADNAVARVAG